MAESPAYTIIPLKGWVRETVFRRFAGYADPLFNLTSEIDVTELKSFSEKEKLPFSSCLYYFALETANSLEAFRIRINQQGDVLLFDRVHGGSTIPHEDGTFGFTYFRHEPGCSLRSFCEDFGRTRQKPEKKQGSLFTTAAPSLSEDRLDIIRHTMIPWCTFTSVKHPRTGNHEDSIPKIAFGRFHKNSAGKLMLPVSIEAHHGLMDGRHASEYFQKLGGNCEF